MDIEKLRAMKGVAQRYRMGDPHRMFFIDNCGGFTGWWDRRSGVYIPDRSPDVFAICDCIVVFADDSSLLLSRDEDAVREFAALWELER